MRVVGSQGDPNVEIEVLVMLSGTQVIADADNAETGIGEFMDEVD
jgi:hypothetical protein